MTVYTRLNNDIKELKEDSKYNLSRIMRRARIIWQTRNSNFDYSHVQSWSDALKQSWSESKKVIVKIREKLNYTIKRLANAYNVEFSDEYKNNQTNDKMMRAYLNGSRMN